MLSSFFVCHSYGTHVFVCFVPSSSCKTVPRDSCSLQSRFDTFLGPFMCAECGMHFEQLHEVQRHLRYKTAWSNDMLIECRVAVMWAHTRWYEGTVTGYDPISGKQCIKYDEGELKWYTMSAKTFYIVSKPENAKNLESESFDEESKDPTEQPIFADNPSLEYAFAQVLGKSSTRALTLFHRSRSNMSFSFSFALVSRSLCYTMHMDLIFSK